MRTAWFIDGAYLFRSAPFDFEFAHLRERIELRLGHTFSDVYFFQAVSDGSPSVQREFAESIQAAKPFGAQARLHLVRANEHPDAAIASHLTLALASAALDGQFATIFFTAPHGFFADALAHLRDRSNVRAALAVYRDADAALHPLADRILWLEDLWDDVD